MIRFFSFPFFKNLILLSRKEVLLKWPLAGCWGHKGSVTKKNTHFPSKKKNLQIIQNIEEKKKSKKKNLINITSTKYLFRFIHNIFMYYFSFLKVTYFFESIIFWSFLSGPFSRGSLSSREGWVKALVARRTIWRLTQEKTRYIFKSISILVHIYAKMWAKVWNKF